jgi:NAD(P)-dependent dehydrogenase (short-subunit alcohol dehydrogenase family)
MLGTMTQPDNSACPVAIVTGASRGLGRALAAQLIQRGERILTIQRKPDPTLDDGGARVEQWGCDLSDPVPVAHRLAQWIAALPPKSVRSLTLINNAAGLSRLADLGDIDGVELARALRVGLEAPMLLSAAFLRASAHLGVPRRLLHVSSGLGRRAMAGSAVYNAAKAGLDHLSRSIALEEAARPGGARSVSIAPGVIDTDMQRELRGADPSAFAAQPQFAALKDNGQLDTPEGCARKLLAYLDRPDFGSHSVADIRDPG